MKTCLKCPQPTGNYDDDLCPDCLVELGREAAEIEGRCNSLCDERDDYYNAYTKVHDDVREAKHAVDAILLFMNNAEDIPRFLTEDVAALSEIIDRMYTDLA